MADPVQRCDFCIIGAGIAGASAAWHLAPHGEVVILERESQPGYHTTGRSAAVFFDSYGPPVVRRLTRASRAFLESPPGGFSESPLLSPCGALFVAREDQLERLDEHLRDVAATGQRIERIDAEALRARVPILRPGYAAAGASEPDAMNMDVHAIHQGYLRGARAGGARLWTDAEVTAIARREGEWVVSTRAGAVRAGAVVNAAGAWCDVIAGLAGVAPVGLVPKRRTAIHLPAPEGVDIAGWPLVADIDEQFYFKADAGRLLCSPADETPMPPCDVQPEELDVAVLVDRLERATTLTVRRIEHRWAGLRSFVPDKGLVIGEDPEAPGFHWLAGQGGYGIQTSPAAGRALASLLVDGELAQDLRDLGLDREALGPGRIRAG